MVFYRQKKYDDALQKFQAAVALKPGDAVLVNNLGYLYHVMGRYDEALSYLEKTLAIDPKRKEAHQNIADTYLKLGRRAEGKQHYERFLELQPGSARSEEVRRILESLKTITNPKMASDLTVGAGLASAAVAGALANVEINLGDIGDQVFVADVRQRVAAVKG